MFNTYLKEGAMTFPFWILVIYYMLNVVKISFFNYYILPVRGIGILGYKLVYTTLIISGFYYIILNIRSKLLFLIFYILQTLYILSNLLYYSYFHSYLHLLQMVTLFSEGFIAAGNFAEPLNIYLLMIFVDLFAVVYIIENYSKIFKIVRKFNKVFLISIALALFSVTLIEVINYKDRFFLSQIANDAYKGESFVVQRYGTIANNILNVWQNKNEKELISHIKYGKDIKNTIASSNNPNFIIIQVESMDSSVINHKYKDKFIAPYLSSLSNNSIFYPYALSFHEGGGTSDVEFSIINSVEPLSDFPAIKLSGYSYPNSMLQILGKRYNTTVFHGNVGTYYNRDIAFPKMGFEQFYDMHKMDLRDSGWGAPDKYVFDYVLEKLETITPPYLSYIITMTSHGPFTNAGYYYKNENYKDIKNKTVKNYYNSISYVDDSIKNFVEQVRLRFKNTYIFITGDHTPNINTELYKQSSVNIGSTKFEFVPLFIITPENKIHKEDKQIASFLDISPTVLYASGMKFQIKTDGKNLLTLDNINKYNIPYRSKIYDRMDLFNKIEQSILIK